VTSPITFCAVDPMGHVAFMFSPMPESWIYPSAGRDAADLDREIRALLAERFENRSMLIERGVRASDSVRPEDIEAAVDRLLSTWVEEGWLQTPAPNPIIVAARNMGRISREYFAEFSAPRG
jgi:hypothetical protein